MTPVLRYAAASDTGLTRSDNQDSGYAGPYLIAVADGVSGNAHGETASAATIQTLARLDLTLPAAEAAEALRTAVTDADTRLREMAEVNPSLLGMSTTLTALLCAEQTLHVAHVGDSRAYLLTDGVLHQVTKDHSLVQALVDDGQLTPEEAAVHPQRSVILRAINGRGDVQADIDAHRPRLGDRWLLCSDGLSDYVGREPIHDVLAAGGDLAEIAARLIDMANDAGGPDNITCAVADIVDDAPPATGRTVVGAAADTHEAGTAGDEPTRRYLHASWQSLLPGPIGSQARVAGTPTPALASTPTPAGTTVLDLHR